MRREHAGLSRDNIMLRLVSLDKTENLLLSAS